MQRHAKYISVFIEMIGSDVCLSCMGPFLLEFSSGDIRAIQGIDVNVM